MINRPGPILIQADKLTLSNSMREFASGDRGLRRLKRLEAFHHPALHLNCTMILLNNVVKVFTRTDLHPTPSRMLASQKPPCTMAGLMAIERHLQGTMAAVRRERFAEERLGCSNAAGTTQIEIDGAALLTTARYR